MFWKLFTAVLAGNAVERALHDRPQKYWYANGAQPQLPPGSPYLLQQPGPPADWYPDPADAQALRWWDGYQWTHHTAQAAQPAQPLLEA